MLMPKRVKYRKPHSHPRIKGPAKRGVSLSFGEFGLKALEPKWVTARQIESSRVTISRHLKKGGKLWVRIFPDKAITKHPAETRMGKGKGAPDHWAAVVRPGRVLFEVMGLTREEAQKALKMASYKLPIRTKFIAREHV
ncbi:MAG TPA: 50S ribosomal protein L16 [Elusimicrobia bacterium]|nr:MAG: 50S ribosomal protein L16 [Elusimicrobia bacterium GWA2_66_18]OGR73870.1 MAG: 50S ribosomal protein L16 [Elusimicrobia bacterium GWC2_65_9]HAZ07326.1 50S ribosomal protein L16 [Elusimicrobiota bacterium]